MKPYLVGLFSVAFIILPALGNSSQNTPKQGKSFQFAGIPWGSDQDTIREKMEAAGFSFMKVDEDGDLHFGGTVLGTPAVVFCVLGQGRLLKVIVSILTPDQKARYMFDEMMGSLVKKYGQGRFLEGYESPYEKGDGYEDQAIKVGKGHVLCLWGPDTMEGSTYPEGLLLKISERLTVDVTYESSGWGPEADRRKARATTPF